MDAHRARPWARRLAWLGALWLAGVAALGALAGLLRLFMRAAGLGA
jgi:hypothetical protein